MKSYTITTEDEMKSLAYEIAGNIQGGEIIALVGDLGAGKTFFTQKLGEYFSIADAITSPTFVLMKQYETANQISPIRHLVHVDAYRLDDPQELFYIGIEEHIGKPDTLVVIEWADKAREYINGFNHVLWVTIELRGEKRIVSISS